MFVGSFVLMFVASGVPLLVSTVVSVILVTGIRHYCWLYVVYWSVYSAMGEDMHYGWLSGIL